MILFNLVSSVYKKFPIAMNKSIPTKLQWHFIELKCTQEKMQKEISMQMRKLHPHEINHSNLNWSNKLDGWVDIQ